VSGPRTSNEQREFLQEGAARPFKLDERIVPLSILVHHPASAAAKGLSFLIQRNIDERWAKEALLALMLHPLEAVYESMVASCLVCWTNDPRFGWIAFSLAGC
jgi:hypothetical protein